MSSLVVVQAAAGAAKEEDSLSSIQLQRVVVREVESAERGKSKAREAGTSRLKEVGNATQEKAPEGDVKSSRCSVVGDTRHEERQTL
jgi:hypothetical protein